MKINQKKILLTIIISLLVIVIYNYVNLEILWHENLEEGLKLYKEYPHLFNFPYKLNYVDTFFYLVDSTSIKYIKFIFPFLIILPAIYELSIMLKSKFFEYYVTRKKYKNVIINWISKAYLPCFIMPIIISMVLLASYIYSINCSPKYLFPNFVSVSSIVGFQINNIIFFILFIINIFLVSVFFVNISLIVVNYVKRTSLTVIMSFLIITGYQIASECLLAPILVKISGKEWFLNYFSFYNLWYYDGDITPYMAMIHLLILDFFTGFIIYKKFHKLENVVIESEK